MLFTDGSAYREAWPQGNLCDKQTTSNETDLALFPCEVRGVVKASILVIASHTTNSGPKKYSYETKKRVWQNLRDGHALCELLSKELTQLSGTQLRLKDPEV